MLQTIRTSSPNDRRLSADASIAGRMRTAACGSSMRVHLLSRCDANVARLNERPAPRGNLACPVGKCFRPLDRLWAHEWIGDEAITHAGGSGRLLVHGSGGRGGPPAGGPWCPFAAAGQGGCRREMVTASRESGSVAETAGWATKQVYAIRRKRAGTYRTHARLQSVGGGPQRNGLLRHGSPCDSLAAPVRRALLRKALMPSRRRHRARFPNRRPEAVRSRARRLRGVRHGMPGELLTTLARHYLDPVAHAQKAPLPCPAAPSAGRSQREPRVCGHRMIRRPPYTDILPVCSGSVNR